MIASALLWLLTPQPDWAKPFHMAWESTALWSRATRRRKDWQPHEARCHTVIEGVIAELPRRRKVVVLGSGLARDIPLDRLSAAFGEVALVDAIHLPPIRRRVKRFPNVSLMTLDLTGSLGFIAGIGEEKREPLEDFLADENLDLTISALCLSQLPLLIEDYLDKHGREDAEIGKNLIARHLEGLQKLPGRVVLLTDTVMEEVARDGTLTDSLDLMRGNALPSADEEWDWWVAPRGEKHRSFAYRHHVHAYRDYKALSPRP